MFDRTNELLASIDHHLQMIASNLNMMDYIMVNQLREEERYRTLSPHPPPPPPPPPPPIGSDDDVYLRLKARFGGPFCWV